ncbi:hypothetical protein BH20BAC1_BH20BAC1_26930 [soil metagenome]
MAKRKTREGSLTIKDPTATKGQVLKFILIRYQTYKVFKTL